MSSYFDETIKRHTELRDTLRSNKLFVSNLKLGAITKTIRDEILSNLDPLHTFVFDRTKQLTPEVFLNTYLGAGNRSRGVETMRFYILFNESNNTIDDFLKISQTSTLPFTFRTTQIA